MSRTYKNKPVNKARERNYKSSKEGKMNYKKKAFENYERLKMGDNDEDW